MPTGDKKATYKAHVQQLGVKAASHVKTAAASKANKIQKFKDEKHARREQAAQARRTGDRFLFPIGGAHDWVTAQNAAIRSDLYLESNHSPPNASYAGSKYESIPIGARPAHAMYFYHHRSPSGSVGGASSTGGSGVHTGWSGDLNTEMRAGRFGVAMRQDFIDLLNTTAPNRGFYALALYRAAIYARNHTFSFKDGTSGPLLSQQEFEDIIALLQGHLTGEDLAEAVQTSVYAT